MQLGTGSKKAIKDVAVTTKPTWRAKLTLATLRQWFAPKKGYDHKLLMRQDWTAKAEKYFLFGSLLTFSLLPEFANADMDFSALTNLAKSVVTFLIFDLGYYIGIAAIAIQGLRAKSGRISWAEFIATGIGVFIVFFAPNIVTTIKSGAASSI